MTHWFGAFASLCISTAQRHRRLLISIEILLTIASAFFVANNLGINTDTSAVLSSDLPFRKLAEQTYAVFPHLRDQHIVIVDRESGDALEKAQEFAVFLEKNASVAQVFVMAVPRHPSGDASNRASVSGPTKTKVAIFEYLLRSGGEHSTESVLSSATELLFFCRRSLGNEDERNRACTSRTDLGLLETAVVAVLSALGGDHMTAADALLFSESPRERDHTSNRAFVLVSPVLDFSSTEPAASFLRDVRLAATQTGLQRGHEIRVTGEAALATEEMVLVRRQVGLVAVVVALAFVGIILIATLRSATLVLLSLITLIFGLIHTAMFATLALGTLNLTSMAFGVLLVGLGIDFCIHFCIRFQEQLRSGDSTTVALQTVASTVGPSLVLCTLTTAIGFLSFMPTHYTGVADLGLISATGMVLMLFNTLLFLPALVSISFNSDIPAHRKTTKTVAKRSLTEWPARHAGLVVLTSVAIATYSLSGVQHVQFDPSPINVRPSSMDSVTAMRELINDPHFSPWNAVTIADTRPEADALAEQLSALEEVSLITTVSSIEAALLATNSTTGENVDNQPRLLRALLATQHAQSATPGKPSAKARNARKQQLRELAQTPPVSRFHGSSNLYTELTAQLTDDLDDRPPDPTRKLKLGHTRAAIHEVIDERRAANQQFRHAVMSRYKSADGHSFLVEIAPHHSQDTGIELRQFVRRVQKVAPEATGPAVALVESASAIENAFRRALVLAVIGITLIVAMVWRSFSHTLAIVAVLLWGAVTTITYCQMAGLSFNFANVIVVPLLLGSGVDSGVHLVQRFRLGATAGELLGTTTARAVLASGATTIASFGALALTDHPGMASLGELLAIGVMLMLAANLLLLPALLSFATHRAINLPYRGRTM